MAVVSQNEISMSTPFRNLNITTTTQIATLTKGSFDLSAIYDQMHPVHIPLQNGQCKRSQVDEILSSLEPGSLIHVQFKDQSKGTVLKAKRPRKQPEGTKRSFFLNAICFVMKMDKLVNFKITSKKFQITGCKTTEQAHSVVRIMYDRFCQTDRPCILHEEATPTFVFNTVMTNVDFNLGFLVDRSHLDRMFSEQDEFISLLENSFGHAGVNIKYISKKTNKTLSYICKSKGVWTQGSLSTLEFWDMLSEKEKAHEQKRKCMHTFLVFHSGRGIHSGPCFEEMEHVYTMFMKVLYEKKDEYQIEEILDTTPVRLPAELVVT